MGVVHNAVIRQGKKCAIFDRYSTTDTITISSKNDGDLQICCAEGAVTARDIVSVWWRLKPIVFWQPLATQDAIAAEFATKEWIAFLSCLPDYLSRARWINPPVQQRIAADKPYQLRVAATCGFAVPETIFSNSPDQVFSFVDPNKRFVYKQLSGFMFPPEHFIYTNEIVTSDLRGREPNVQAAPGIYQELVEKRAEWRVTVIGDSVFPVRIDSQKSPDTAIDWRRGQLTDIYDLADFDAAVGRKILKVHEQLGLIYGAYDLIERPDGEIVFLECNPAGAWLWLEEATGLPIADCLALSLAHPSAV